jgi:glycosyltransferase involved in cell wall biosynthesis
MKRASVRSEMGHTGLPTVTWITPTYNRAGLLVETIESVLAQEYPDIDYLVLDDGSDDETPELLERYARRHPDRIRWVRHENIGEARTINRGFGMARGEFIGKLSSDDLLDRGATRAVVDAIRADPGVVAAYPSYRMIDLGGTTLYEVEPMEFTTVEALRLCDPTIGPGALARKTAIEQVGGWDPEFIYCGDLDFWLRISLVGAFRRLRDVLVSYRLHETSVSSGAGFGERLARERIEVVDKFYARPEVPLDALEVRGAAYRSAYIYAGLFINECDESQDRFIVTDAHPTRCIRRPTSHTGMDTPSSFGLGTDHEVPAHTIKWLHREVAARDATIRELQSAVAEQQRRLAEYDEYATALSREPREPRELRELQEQHSEANNPRWRRVARSLTPAPIKRRIGIWINRRRSNAPSDSQPGGEE